MNKFLRKIALMLLLGTGFFAHAQEEVNTSFYENQVMRYSQLNPANIPTGILFEAGFPFTNIETFNGTVLPDSVYVNGGTVKSIYKTIFSSILDETNESLYSLQIPDEYEEEWFSARNPDEVILSGMLFKYNLFKENALQQEEIFLAEDGALIDVPGQNPYTEDYTVGIAPGFNTFYGKEMNVKLPASLFKTNLQDQIEVIEIDFGDGQGFRTVQLNQTIPIAYTTAGSKEWRYKIHLAGGFILDSRTRIDIIDWTNPIPIAGSTFCSPFNSVRKITAAKSHLGATGELNLTVRCSGDGIINNPLIVVEGFDIGNIFDPENQYGTTNITSFRRAISESTDLNNLLFNTGREYDIIYVDWINGMDYMERNAFALEEAINWVNAVKQGNEPNVIVGQSMGGVVTRLALTNMENNNEVHDTNLFISHDAPQQGANIPDSYQFMYRHLTQMYIKVKSGTRIFNLKIIPTNLINKMNGVAGMLDQPAAKQLLRYWVAGDYSYNNSVHNDFYTQLRQMNSNGGYPELTRNIALSNGSECGATQHNVFPHDNLLNVHFSNKPTLLSDVIGSAIGPIAGAFGGWLFKDWNVFLTGLKATISSNKKVTLNLWAKSMRESAGLQEHVYHADLTYSQKVLWVINDNTNIFYKDAHSRSGTEFSHFGGGNFQIYDDTNASEIAQFNSSGTIAYNIKPRFNFIPTTSSLDIGNYIHIIGSNNLRASYVGANPPTGIYSSPFANFSTDFNRNNANYHNYRHITFNPRNGTWLANELNAARNPNNTPTTTDCSFFCGLSEITGSEFICDGANYTYSIPELSGADINWSVSGLQIVSGQNTANVVVKDNGGFNVKSIAVTISSNTCGSITLNKPIYSGVPTMFGNIAGWNIIQTNGNQQFSLPLTYTAPSATGVTYYEWVLPGNYQVVSQLGVPTNIPQNWELLASTANTDKISVRSNLGTNGQVKVRACNECGCSTYTTLTVTHQHNQGTPGYEIAPNPVYNDVLSIILKDGFPAPEFSGNYTNVSIYNLQAQKVHQFEMSSEGGNTNVAHLSDGIYRVHIDMQNGYFEVLNLQISR